MDKSNITKCNSYSDLFEDFFRADAAPSESMGEVADQSADLFAPFLNEQSDTMNQAQLSMPNDNLYFMQQYQQQQQQQQQQTQFFYPPQAQQAHQMQHFMPVNAAAIHKPGFIRNRTRKNMRQKSVAAAVKASHMMATVGQAGGYPFVQNYQAQAQIPVQAQTQAQVQLQVPYYQVAAQIPAYQQQQQQQHQIPTQVQSQQQPPMLLAKSPAAQAPLFTRSSHPASPARSPNGTSSDYVKYKLQQKIRSRMVSKGQIPPNPTEEELRLCGMQIPNMQQTMLQSSLSTQLPTPKSSPQQIPRAFNNNAAAFIAAPVINQQQTGDQEDIFKYLDLNNYSQKDPLTMASTDSLTTTVKQQQQKQLQQAQDFIYPSQQEAISSNGGVNYDQFFSDFILY